MDVVKMKPSYTSKRKAGTMKYIMQLDKAEKISNDKDGMITLNDDTKKDLINSVFNAL
jgi:hypothetical protein